MNKDKTDEMSLSKAFTELEEITAEFEKGDVDLEKGLPKFKRGLELAKFLKQKLKDIENEITEIKDQYEDEETDEKITSVDLDEEEEHIESTDSGQIPF